MRALLLFVAWAVLAIGAAGLGTESGENLASLLHWTQSGTLRSEARSEAGAGISMCPRASSVDRLKEAASGTKCGSFVL